MWCIDIEKTTIDIEKATTDIEKATIDIEKQPLTLLRKQPLTSKNSHWHRKTYLTSKKQTLKSKNSHWRIEHGTATDETKCAQSGING